MKRIVLLIFLSTTLLTGNAFAEDMPDISDDIAEQQAQVNKALRTGEVSYHDLMKEERKQIMKAKQHRIQDSSITVKEKEKALPNRILAHILFKHQDTITEKEQ